MSSTNLGYRLFSRAVHNDAMREDPPEIYGWRALVLAMSAGWGAMLFGMDSSMISGVVVLPSFLKKFGLDKADSAVKLANLQANIVSTLQAGCFLGAIVAAPIADKIGRRWSLLISGAIVLVGVILQFCSLGYLEALYVGRFINGFGVGICSVVVPTYISENVPRAIRGLLTGCYQWFIVTGGMIAFWTNYGADLHLKGDTAWILPLAIQGIPACLLIGCMWLCNESPRWLAKQDRWEEAKKVLAMVRMLPETHPYVETEYNDMVSQLENERLLMAGAGFKDLMKEMWIVPGNRKRAIISVVLMICQQMTGTNAINSYAPLMFRNMGIDKRGAGLFATGIYGVVKVVSCTIFLLFMADTIGRRRSLLWTSIGQGICMFFIGLFIRIKPPVTGQPTPPVGYVALTCIFIFAALFQFGWGPCCWIYCSEIPTARLRALNVSLAASTQWLFNFVVTRSVPAMLVTVGNHGYGTYLIFGSFAFSMFFFVWFFVPETKGLSLEAMDALFGVVPHGTFGLEGGLRKNSQDSTEKDVTSTQVEAVPADKESSTR